MIDNPDENPRQRSRWGCLLWAVGSVFAVGSLLVFVVGAWLFGFGPLCHTLSDWDSVCPPSDDVPRPDDFRIAYEGVDFGSGGCSQRSFYFTVGDKTPTQIREDYHELLTTSGWPKTSIFWDRWMNAARGLEVSLYEVEPSKINFYFSVSPAPDPSTVSDGLAVDFIYSPSWDGCHPRR